MITTKLFRDALLGKPQISRREALRYFALVAAAFATFALPISPVAAKERQSEIEVMILGVYHFSSPQSDIVNIEIDDFLEPRRQRELDDLAQALGQWKPTRIVVEQEADGPGFLLEDYAHTEQLLLTQRNETVQIGYRLARLLEHEAVYGFDEKARHDEPDYFPFESVQSFAGRSDKTELIEALINEIQAASEVEKASMAKLSIAETLFQHNNPDKVTRMHHQFYYSMLSIGDGDAQPGAELNAYWYMRNAKMFAKLDLIAELGDRVLVIVGSGHLTWLRHFAERMPNYRLVETMPYLIAAAALDNMQ
ncbi:DUF5694 domain-containing protein [Qipengyuania seohaensis]|uniref:DUF5694 domain-containing protein n=1 Tax=Qipengyuania seohaensis TaxID=266951 RepID=UPI001E4CD14F|nr:DUF5694 domain-containing protein [Qipengyuania seohaensis]